MGKQKSRDDIQKAIKSGAVTKEYKADPKHMIRELDTLRSTEITSYCNTSHGNQTRVRGK